MKFVKGWRNFILRFWQWYEKHYTLHVTLAAFLFTLQLIHLYWLTNEVVLWQLIGRSFFKLQGFWEIIIAIVDYTEIPAIISTTLVYLNELRKRGSLKGWLYIFFINSQWLHLFWITDEYVLDIFTDQRVTLLPVWLAWLAVVIDYFELPVIYDTIKKSFKLLQAILVKN